MRPASERAIERYLVRRVREEDGWALKLFPFAVRGIPDRLLLRAGRVKFVELKTPTGRVSKVQLAVHHRLERLGFPVAVVRTKDEIETVIEELKR